MQGTATRLRADSASRLAGLERDRPEWKTWLALLREVEPELEDDRWLPAGYGLDARRLHRLVRRLIAITVSSGESGAAALREYQPDRDEVVRLITAELRGDHDSGPLASIAHLAALPVLHACRRQLEGRVPLDWAQGYCPLCGAWPVLAERRGLDRSRWLRCGRCASGWEVQPLWCTYCGERDHRKLGSLVPDGSGDMLKVDTCETCRAYLKSVATLQAIAPFQLLLQDLETVELDLVAGERGYERPRPVAGRQSLLASHGLAPSR